MKPVVTRLYAVLAAMVLVSLIVWSCADWYQLQQKAERSVQTTLRHAAGQISDLSIRRVELGPEAMNRVFAPTIGPNSPWKMVLLVSPERGTEYYRGPRPLVPVDQAVPSWSAKPFFEVKASLTVFRAQGDPMVLVGIYEFYGRAEIFGLLVAVGTALVLWVILLALFLFQSARLPDPEEETPSAFDEDPLADPFDTESAEGESEEPLVVATEEAAETTDEYWFDENLTLDDLPPLEDLPPLGEQPLPDSVTAATETPTLFSPTTGLGWETFLLTRLENELLRSAEQNQDLALILFAIKEGHVETEAWGKAVREAFPSTDLDFEYEGGAAVVLPGRTLEQALKAARGFVESSDSFLGEALVHAGVASRTGRLISAQTLLGEAASAKRRSLVGTVRVLGLKTDPDRYREHLAGDSASA